MSYDLKIIRLHGRETLDSYRKRRVNQFRELLKNNEKIREKL